MMTEAVSPVAPCVAWHCGNKDECNREEGNCCYPSHFYLTTTRMVDPRQIGVKRRLGSVGFETDKEIKSVSASTLSEEYAAKWVELLKEVVPRASLVALLWNPKNMHAARAKAVQDAAKALRVKLESFEVGDPGEFDGTFAAMTRKRVDGLIVIGDPLTVRYRTRDRGTRGKEPAVDDLRLRGICSGRWPHGLWSGRAGHVPSRGRLRGQDPQGRRGRDIGLV